MPMKCKFLNSSKNEIYVIKLYVSYTHTKFQNNIFIFGCAMTEKKKTGKTDGVTF